MAENTNYSDIGAMKLIPPYPTEMFLYNFDDSEFCNEEKNVLKMIEEEKGIDLTRKRFSNFDYVSDEITAIKRLLSMKENERFNFYKPKIKPRETYQKLYSRNESLNQSNRSKNSNSQGRKNEIKTVEKHYFPSKSPERKTNAPWIQN